MEDPLGHAVPVAGGDPFTERSIFNDDTRASQADDFLL
jgi:hypothetical protein